MKKPRFTTLSVMVSVARNVFCAVFTVGSFLLLLLRYLLKWGLIHWSCWVFSKEFSMGLLIKRRWNLVSCSESRREAFWSSPEAPSLQVVWVSSRLGLDSTWEMGKIKKCHQRVFLKTLKYFEHHCLKHLRNARHFKTEHKRRLSWWQAWTLP